MVRWQVQYLFLTTAVPHACYHYLNPEMRNDEEVSCFALMRAGCPRSSREERQSRGNSWERAEKRSFSARRSWVRVGRARGRGDSSSLEGRVCRRLRRLGVLGDRYPHLAMWATQMASATPISQVCGLWEW